MEPKSSEATMQEVLQRAHLHPSSLHSLPLRELRQGTQIQTQPLGMRCLQYVVPQRVSHGLHHCPEREMFASQEWQEGNLVLRGMKGCVPYSSAVTCSVCSAYSKQG